MCLSSRCTRRSPPAAVHQIQRAERRDLEKTIRVPIPAAGAVFVDSVRVRRSPRQFAPSPLSPKDPNFIDAIACRHRLRRRRLLRPATTDRTSTWLPNSLAAAPRSTRSLFRRQRRSTSALLSSARHRHPPRLGRGIDPLHLASRFRRRQPTIEIAEFVLHPGARVNRFEEKAAFVPRPISTASQLLLVAAVTRLRNPT